MANNPVEHFLQTLGTFTQCVQTKLSNYFQSAVNIKASKVAKVGDDSTIWHLTREAKGGAVQKKKRGADYLDTTYLAEAFQSTDESSVKDKPGRPVSKEELGRATWTLLHTLAAQFPEKPTKQQKRDVKELMVILSRVYPCKDCGEHFKEILKANPVQVDSGAELAQWMCQVHNIVNRSLDKPKFPCQRVDARWGALECDEGACDLQGRRHSHDR
jgi:FAD-linked sulfhydryl oxidase